MSTGSASAPGSSANLGPGFDVLAIAWELRCRASVTRAERWRVRQNEEEWTPREGEFVKRAAQAGGAGPFLIEIENDVPRSRGLAMPLPTPERSSRRKSRFCATWACTRIALAP